MEVVAGIYRDRFGPARDLNLEFKVRREIAFHVVDGAEDSVPGALGGFDRVLGRSRDRDGVELGKSGSDERRGWRAGSGGAGLAHGGNLLDTVFSNGGLCRASCKLLGGFENMLGLIEVVAHEEEIGGIEAEVKIATVEFYSFQLQGLGFFQLFAMVGIQAREPVVSGSEGGIELKGGAQARFDLQIGRSALTFHCQAGEVEIHQIILRVELDGLLIALPGGFAIVPSSAWIPVPGGKGDQEEPFPYFLKIGEVFDGPFDVLLALIRKQNLDINDLPIAQITKQFQGYVKHLRREEVDTAGEFVHMASQLIFIKSCLLLPSERAA